ncbi:MAG TPA: hypothetical protein ACFYEA_09945 [Candidatus Tripitaka californicus]|uniref:hypothetical protein n=1 Tax=Candidatus Tripitaka californicus TaxID=3367616 RepID=UPI004026755D|nr:hypothetical protein [Planctomycetota bacterium]
MGLNSLNLLLGVTPDHRLHLCFVIAFFINGLLSSPVFSQTYVINGTLENPAVSQSPGASEKYSAGALSPVREGASGPVSASGGEVASKGGANLKGQETTIKDSVIRKESLAIKDKRVYIQLLIDQGSRKISERERYKHLLFLLPEEVVYDDVSNRIFCYRGNTEIEIGRRKSFLGFMPYIALADGVRILSSPTDAKLLVSLNKNNQWIPDTIIHSEAGMEETLGKKCGQCHVLEYVFSHKNWSEEDILHAFNRMQMEKEESFTENEQRIINLFKEYQRGTVDKEKLAEFKTLRQIGRKDVIDVTEGVYMNNCVPCHSPSKMTDITLLYSKQRCKSIIDRMKEKEPSLFLRTDTDRLASFLWETRLRPSKQ